MTNYREIEPGEMLDRITGDNPPPLESWSARDWMRLHQQHSAWGQRLDASLAEIDRLRAQLTKLVEAARDVLLVLDTGERSGAGSCLGQLRAVLDEIEKGEKL